MKKKIYLIMKERSLPFFLLPSNKQGSLSHCGASSSSSSTIGGAERRRKAGVRGGVLYSHTEEGKTNGGTSRPTTNMTAPRRAKVGCRGSERRRSSVSVSFPADDPLFTAIPAMRATSLAQQRGNSWPRGPQPVPPGNRLHQ